jgi:hypothetical protein
MRANRRRSCPRGAGGVELRRAPALEVRRSRLARDLPVAHPSRVARRAGDRPLVPRATNTCVHGGVGAVDGLPGAAGAPASPRIVVASGLMNIHAAPRHGRRSPRKLLRASLEELRGETNPLRRASVLSGRVPVWSRPWGQGRLFPQRGVVRSAWEESDGDDGVGPLEEGRELPACIPGRGPLRPLQVHVPPARTRRLSAGSGADPGLGRLRRVQTAASAVRRGRPLAVPSSRSPGSLG